MTVSTRKERIMKRFVLLSLLISLLAGCVVVPAGYGYYGDGYRQRSYGYYGGYYGYGYRGYGYRDHGQ
jgi:hypothetical protein